MQRNYSRIPAFVAKNPDGFTESGVRWLRFNRDKNGFASAFVTVGRNVLIDEDRFFEIIAEQNGRKADAGAADPTTGA